MYDPFPRGAPGLSNPGLPPAWRRLPEGQKCAPQADWHPGLPGPPAWPEMPSQRPEWLNCPQRSR